MKLLLRPTIAHILVTVAMLQMPMQRAALPTCIGHRFSICQMVGCEMWVTLQNNNGNVLDLRIDRQASRYMA